MPQYPPFELTIDYLDDRARGIAYLDNVRYTCDGLLPGEKIRVNAVRQDRRHISVTAYDLISHSPDRVEPHCRYFTDCGGCQLQHLAYPAQINTKLSVLKNALDRHGKLQPVEWLPPLTGNPYQYRRRARLGVYLQTNGEVVIGFRRKHHSHILDLHQCDILEPRLAALLMPLHILIQNLSCPNRIPQVELAAGDETIAVIIRHLVALSAQDNNVLQQFSQHHHVNVFTQNAGPDSAKPIAPKTESSLGYITGKIHMRFLATDFIQANIRLSAQLINEVLLNLDLRIYDKVLELFSGIGNFTLPIATSCAHILALEGHPVLVERAQQNAAQNEIQNISFVQVDLRNSTAAFSITDFTATKLLLDPPREGAIEILKQLDYDKIERIVYVSCNPDTLCRDLGYLVHQHHYRLQSIRVVDMFPQTTHIETVTLLSKQLPG